MILSKNIFGLSYRNEPQQWWKCLRKVYNFIVKVCDLTVMPEVFSFEIYFHLFPFKALWIIVWIHFSKWKYVRSHSIRCCRMSTAFKMVFICRLKLCSLKFNNEFQEKNVLSACINRIWTMKNTIKTTKECCSLHSPNPYLSRAKQLDLFISSHSLHSKTMEEEITEQQIAMFQKKYLESSTKSTLQICLDWFSFRCS